MKHVLKRKKNRWIYY